MLLCIDNKSLTEIGEDMLSSVMDYQSEVHLLTVQN